MKLPKLNRRALSLLAVLLPLLGAFLWLALTSGPLAPVLVTLVSVEERAIAPALFGVGTVEARYTYRIGPTIAGRVSQVAVQVGDRVRAGQRLGEMDPVDLDERLAAQDAALRRAESGVVAARAQVRDAQARRDFASAQVGRYEQLLLARTASEDTAEAKRQEAQIAEAGVALGLANLESAEQDLGRVRAERAALVRQQDTLRLVAPADGLPLGGLVVSRDAEPGSTVVAGQSVVEVVDPASLWVDVRFDQLGSGALRAGLAARIALRSQPLGTLDGRVARVEPRADAITEELLAKVVFANLPDPLPRLGELAEVSVALAPRPAAPAVPNAALHRRADALGVWVLDDGEPRFVPVTIGARDLLAIGSLGASAVLVFGAVRSPLAQPRNLVGGHVLSALVGVTCWQWLGGESWLAQAVAVATAIALMHLTRTLHPPGGATALIAVIGSDQVHAMGYLFVLLPATLGPLVLLAWPLPSNFAPIRWTRPCSRGCSMPPITPRASASCSPGALSAFRPLCARPSMR